MCLFSTGPFNSKFTKNDLICCGVNGFFNQNKKDDIFVLKLRRLRWIDGGLVILVNSQCYIFEIVTSYIQRVRWLGGYDWVRSRAAAVRRFFSVQIGCKQIMQNFVIKMDWNRHLKYIGLPDMLKYSMETGLIR